MWSVESYARSQGMWSTEGCRLLTSKSGYENNHFVTCECAHLSTFTVIMDVTNDEVFVILYT